MTLDWLRWTFPGLVPIHMQEGKERLFWVDCYHCWSSMILWRELSGSSSNVPNLESVFLYSYFYILFHSPIANVQIHSSPCILKAHKQLSAYSERSDCLSHHTNLSPSDSYLFTSMLWHWQKLLFVDIELQSFFMYIVLLPQTKIQYWFFSTHLRAECCSQNVPFINMCW